MHIKVKELFAAVTKYCSTDDRVVSLIWKLLEVVDKRIVFVE